MKKTSVVVAAVAMCVMLVGTAMAGIWGEKVKTLTPAKGRLVIPVASVNDGKAHYFKAQAADGVMVTFFVLKSNDGVIRAAVDACDVCYRAGKGYEQDGDEMVCLNCGQRFASVRINEVKGGCNPAPLTRTIEGEKLVIAMADIDRNSWYCKYKK
ncbi:MAG: DUF2318 domain-containing protein [Desulfobulbaceae bacterium]|nr:DUF2318 domain-containing protein [Desulfobulbaceae bacterium]HIJ90204.1 DUF2318 domain-containing protein [Deltaproteobacteria bacterium]